MIRSALTVAVLAVLSAPPAQAGLQRWDVVYLDKAGNPTAYGAAASAEAWAADSRGYELAIGCAPGGGHVLALTAPKGSKPDFAGPAIEPGIRISMPGTDLFSGTVAMTFDGRRYVGPVPEPVLASLRSKIRDGQLMLTELATHTTVKLKLQSMERAIAEVTCR